MATVRVRSKRAKGRGGAIRPSPFVGHFPPIRMALPWPPSTNALWRSPKGLGRVIKSEKGRAYESRVRDVLVANRVPCQYVGGRLKLTMLLHPPDARRRDMDNTLKATLDALVKWGVLHDDSCVQEIHMIRYGPDHTGHGRVWLEIAPRGE